KRHDAFCPAATYLSIGVASAFAQEDRSMHRAAFVSLAVFLNAAPAFATWSVVALDRRSGAIVVASATCVPQAAFIRRQSTGLRGIQGIGARGVGAAAAQAEVDNTRANQRLIYAELLKGTDPAAILELLRQDPAIEVRQFGILDMQGRHAAWSGAKNQAS